MSELKRFQLLDFVAFFVRRKMLFLKVFLSSILIIYLAIFFLVQEQFEATATIIPREEDLSSAASGLLRGVRNLPLGLGTNSANSDVDLYKTIIFSRTTLEDVIHHFGLLEVYGLDTTKPDHMENAVKRLSKEISTKETEESAFVITVRAGTRTRAADITNYVVQLMNDRIIDLKVSRSRQNRMFLEQRVAEISAQLRMAEDSLRAFQERTGLLDVKSQLQGILSAYTSLETELTAKRFKQGILERLYDKGSPQVKEVEIQVQEYEKKLAQLRTQGDPGSPLLPLKQLPQTSTGFLRRYRDVELDNLLMQYVVPLYEQARIEEKKDYPVLQVIDRAIPPSRKSWPPRTLLSVIGSISVTIAVGLVLWLRTVMITLTNPRLVGLLREARSWKRPSPIS